MEANIQGQEEVEAQVIDAQGVLSPPQRLTRSQFKELGNNGRLFSLFIVSCVITNALRETRDTSFVKAFLDFSLGAWGE